MKITLKSLPRTNHYSAMRVNLFSRKHREPLKGFELTTDTLQVRISTHSMSLILKYGRKRIAGYAARVSRLTFAHCFRTMSCML